MAIVALAAGGSDQYVCWVEGNGDLKTERVLVWAAKDVGKLPPSPFIWCCDEMRDLGHVIAVHKPETVWVGEPPQ